MIYIFIFLGEFGYELFNWQGVIRKFRRLAAPQDKIVCCSRAAVHPLYEVSDAYVNVSEVPLFRQSRAMAYFALPSPASSWDSWGARRFNTRIKEALCDHIRHELHQRGWALHEGTYRFVFSSDKHELAGVSFGRRRHGIAGMCLATAYEQVRARAADLASRLEDTKARFYARFPRFDNNRDANIYDYLDLESNDYICVEPDFRVANEVRGRLGHIVDGPFILCQMRQRFLKPLSPDRLPVSGMVSLLETLAQRLPVVLLNFDTGRYLDSYSAFAALPGCHGYHCRSFLEQSYLVHRATHCLFFTEGDFGSHIYVPPFMGRDVTAVAPASVYDLHTTPIAFWNRHVFKFGGQILPQGRRSYFQQFQFDRDIHPGPSGSSAGNCRRSAGGRLKLRFRG